MPQEMSVISCSSWSDAGVTRFTPGLAPFAAEAKEKPSEQAMWQIYKFFLHRQLPHNRNWNLKGPYYNILDYLRNLEHVVRLHSATELRDYVHRARGPLAAVAKRFWTPFIDRFLSVRGVKGFGNDGRGEYYLMVYQLQCLLYAMRHEVQCFDAKDTVEIQRRIREVTDLCEAENTPLEWSLDNLTNTSIYREFLALCQTAWNYDYEGINERMCIKRITVKPRDAWATALSVIRAMYVTEELGLPGTAELLIPLILALGAVHLAELKQRPGGDAEGGTVNSKENSQQWLDCVGGFRHIGSTRFQKDIIRALLKALWPGYGRQTRINDSHENVAYMKTLGRTLLQKPQLSDEDQSLLAQIQRADIEPEISMAMSAAKRRNYSTHGCSRAAAVAVKSWVYNERPATPPEPEVTAAWEFVRLLIRTETFSPIIRHLNVDLQQQTHQQLLLLPDDDTRAIVAAQTHLTTLSDRLTYAVREDPRFAPIHDDISVTCELALLHNLPVTEMLNHILFICDSRPDSLHLSRLLRGLFFNWHDILSPLGVPESCFQEWEASAGIPDTTTPLRLLAPADQLDSDEFSIRARPVSLPPPLPTPPTSTTASPSPSPPKSRPLSTSSAPASTTTSTTPSASPQTTAAPASRRRRANPASSEAYENLRTSILGPRPPGLPGTHCRARGAPWNCRHIASTDPNRRRHEMKHVKEAGGRVFTCRWGCGTSDHRRDNLGKHEVKCRRGRRARGSNPSSDEEAEVEGDGEVEIERGGEDVAIVLPRTVEEELLPGISIASPRSSVNSATFESLLSTPELQSSTLGSSPLSSHDLKTPESTYVTLAAGWDSPPENPKMLDPMGVGMGMNAGVGMKGELGVGTGVVDMAEMEALGQAGWTGWDVWEQQMGLGKEAKDLAWVEEWVQGGRAVQ